MLFYMVTNNSRLVFNYGSMSSGKSLNLLIKAHNLDEKGIPILVIKPSIDTREEAAVVRSRIGIERPCILVDKKMNLFNLAIKNRFCRIILVDECQFLTPQQVDQLAKVVDTIGINVICYGLRTDFKSRLFAGSKRLFEIADSIEELKSYCDCGKKAIINARFDSSGNMIVDGEQIVIGGDDTYRAICRECFFNNLNKLSINNETSNKEGDNDKEIQP